MSTSLNKILLKKTNPTITIKNAGLIKGRVAIKTKGKKIFSFSKNKKSATVTRKIDKDSVSNSWKEKLVKDCINIVTKKILQAYCYCASLLICKSIKM